jgi:PEGA domain
MKRDVLMWLGVAAVAAWVAASPAAAQDRATATPSSGGGGGAAASAPSGGGGGGSTSSNSGGGGGGERAGATPGSFGGGNRGEAGGHGGATGGSGIAMPRGDHSVGHYSDSSAGRSNAAGGRRGEGDREGVPEFSRPRDGAPAVGTAVPRPAGSIPPTKGGSNIVIVPGGYYGGYYGYGYPYSGYYGSFYGGYYDPFYDPWYGGYYSPYGTYGSSGTYGQSSYSGGIDDGALRLKIKPREAEVYVDGYYVGVVDEFDGMFQRLHIEPGAHRVEVRASGYETLVFEVKISPEHTTTYQGDLKKVQ